ncbi:MAG: hypothetical protein R3E86_17235 [Pseudomonadales bacterium]
MPRMPSPLSPHHKLWIQLLALSMMLAASAAGAAMTPAECAAIEASQERLACYDGLFRVRVATETTAPAERLDPPAPTPAHEPAPPAADPADEFGREQMVRGKVAAAEQAAEPEEITSRITAIVGRTRGEALYELENGQAWAQTTPRYLTIREGDLVTVHRGRLGGYTLTNERGTSTKVQRIR